MYVCSFGFIFNHLSSQLVGMFLEIVPMFVDKKFARRRFVAQICANSFPARTHILAQVE